MKSTIDQSKQFNELVNQYSIAWLRFHPRTAFDCGHYEFAQALTPFDNNTMGALLTLHENLLSTLEEMDYEGLDDELKLDFDLILGHAYLERLQMLQQDWRFRKPMNYLPHNSLKQLLLAPIDESSKIVSTTLKRMPDYLFKAQQLISQHPELIAQVWLEQSIQRIEDDNEFIEKLKHHPSLTDIKEDVDNAAMAINNFHQFLEQDVAAQAPGEIACGSHRYNKLLQLKHAINIDDKQLYNIAGRLLKDTKKQLFRVCKSLTGQASVKAVEEKIASLANMSQLNDVDIVLKQAKSFIQENQLVSVIDGVDIRTMRYPDVLMQHNPPLAYYPPKAFQENQTGHVFISEPLTIDRVSLESWIVNQCYPGRHVQFSCRNKTQTSKSWPRLLNTSSTMSAGWAQYCEQLMFENNFFQDPASEFVLLKRRMHRILLMQIDIDLHVNQKSIPKLVQRLTQQLNMPQNQALTDVLDCSHRPTHAIGHALGYEMISLCRDACKNEKFEMKGFHDKLLSCGTIALSKVIERQFGQAVLQKIVKRLNG